jgi:hypothetical protein
MVTMVTRVMICTVLVQEASWYVRCCTLVAEARYMSKAKAMAGLYV